MDKKECFHILSLSPSATLDEAKKAYKALVKRWHPDQFGGDSEKQIVAQDRLKEINVAYREVVGLLKRTPPRGSAAPVQKAAAGPPDPVGGTVNAPTSIFHRISALFRRRKQEPAHWKTPANHRRAAPGSRRTATPHGGTGTGARPPEFQRALRSALRNHPRPVGGGQGTGRSGGGRSGGRGCGQGRGAVFRQPGVCRRGPVDRIEKIRPVGRIKKIGD